MSSSGAIRKPNTMVKASWPGPVASATGPGLRTRWMSGLRPTTNSRIVTPIPASSSIGSCADTRSSIEGPATMPMMMQLTMTG